MEWKYKSRRFEFNRKRSKRNRLFIHLVIDWNLGENHLLDARASSYLHTLKRITSAFSVQMSTHLLLVFWTLTPKPTHDTLIFCQSQSIDWISRRSHASYRSCRGCQTRNAIETNNNDLHVYRDTTTRIAISFDWRSCSLQPSTLHSRHAHTLFSC